MKKGFKRELRRNGGERQSVKGFKLEGVVWREEKKKKETKKRYEKERDRCGD